jgi:NDP-hexose-3-ketoreductase
MSEKTLHIGVLGCSGILPRTLLNPIKEIRDVHLYGISNRTIGKAEAVANEYGIPRVFKDFDSLLDNEEIDMVYIALSNELHAEWTVKALEAGKAVLVEKPLCLHLDEYIRILHAAEQSGALILEGIMVQHHPWQDAVKQMITTHKYGSLRSINSKISIIPKDNFHGNYRSFPERGGGCFHDLGCYWLQFLQYVYGLDVADYDGVSSFEGPNGCDWTFYASALFADGVSSTLCCSFEMPYKSVHVCEFDQATVTINDFFRASLGNYKITIKINHLNGSNDQLVFEPMNYYVNQIQFFVDVVRGKKANIPLSKSFERLSLFTKIMQAAQKKH